MRNKKASMLNTKLLFITNYHLKWDANVATTIWSLSVSGPSVGNNTETSPHINYHQHINSWQLVERGWTGGSWDYFINIKAHDNINLLKPISHLIFVLMIQQGHDFICSYLVIIHQIRQHVIVTKFRLWTHKIILSSGQMRSTLLVIPASSSDNSSFRATPGRFLIII